MKKQAISLKINNPCTQNWDEMRLVGNGRFCGHCDREVVDFRNFTNIQIIDFFANRTNKVCGRFYNWQLNHQITKPSKPKNGIYKLALAIGLTLLFTNPVASKTRLRPPLAQYLANQAPTSLNTDSTGSLLINVTDGESKPLSHVNLTLTLLQKVVYKGFTDNLGCYTFENLLEGEYELIYQRKDYQAKSQIISIKAGAQSRQDLVIEENESNGHLEEMGDVDLADPMPKKKSK